MNSFKNIAIIGSSGALGAEFTKQLANLYPDTSVHAFTSQNNLKKESNNNITYHPINYKDESSIEKASAITAKTSAIDMVIVATGMLHNKDIMPEKSLHDLSEQKFLEIFKANTIFPALIAKHFLPKLNKEYRSIFAALSARVGSISDNQLGGWYSYRSSKAALNMVIKNAAIEIARKNKKAIIVGLHPGTVDSKLSKPFQNSIDKKKLFTPEFSAKALLNTLKKLTHEQSGKCFAWDEKEVEP